MALEAQDNPFPSVLFRETVDPANPSAGDQRLFVDTDHLLKMVDSSGTVTTFTTSSGAVATDSIWDAAGDLAVGTGANTAAKLTMSSVAGGHLARINGALAYDQGTAMPTAVTGDRFYRSDLDMEFRYNGTIWYCTCPHSVQAQQRDDASPKVGDLSTAASATVSGPRWILPSFMGGTNLYLIDHTVVFIVASGGTALGASHKWVGTVVALDSTPASTGTVATVNIDSGSSAIYRRTTTAIAAAVPASTLWFQTSWTKTGTPGTLAVSEGMSYRIITT